MRALYWVIAVLLVTLTGCGVDWLPEFKQLPTTPNPISPQTKTDVEVSTTVNFDSITVSGLAADSSSISVSGDASSKYAINGGTATAAAGTVKNGDTVVVSHTSSTEPGTSVTTTLTIGTAEQSTQGTFTSTTKKVASFALNRSEPPEATVEESTVLKAKPGSYPVSVTNGSFSTDNTANKTFTTSGTINVVAGQPVTLTLRNTAPAAGAEPTVTTITIGGVKSTLTTTAKTTTP